MMSKRAKKLITSLLLVTFIVVFGILIYQITIPDITGHVNRDQNEIHAAAQSFDSYFELFYPMEINGQTNIVNCDVEFPYAFKIEESNLDGIFASLTMNLTFDVSSLPIPETNLTILRLDFETRSRTTYSDDVNFSRLLVKIYNESDGGYSLLSNQVWDHSVIQYFLGDGTVNITIDIPNFVMNGEVKFQLVLEQWLQIPHSNYDLRFYLYYCSLILGQNIEFVPYHPISAEIVEYNSRYELTGSLEDLKMEDNQTFNLEIYPTLQDTLEIVEMDLTFNVNGCQYDEIFGVIIEHDDFFEISLSNSYYYLPRLYLQDKTTQTFNYFTNSRVKSSENTSHCIFVSGNQWVDEDGLLTIRYRLELNDHEGFNPAYYRFDQSVIYIIRRNLPLVNVNVPSVGYVFENLTISIESISFNGIYFHPISSIIFDFGTWQETYDVQDGLNEINMTRNVACSENFDLIIYYDSNESFFVQGHYNIEFRKIDVEITTSEPLVVPFKITGSVILTRLDSGIPIPNKTFNFLVYHGYNPTPDYMTTETTDAQGGFNYTYYIDPLRYLDEYYRITIEVEQDDVYNYNIETIGVICSEAPANITLFSLTPIKNDGYAGDTIEIEYMIDCLVPLYQVQLLLNDTVLHVLSSALGIIRYNFTGVKGNNTYSIRVINDRMQVSQSNSIELNLLARSIDISLNSWQHHDVLEFSLVMTDVLTGSYCNNAQVFVEIRDNGLLVFSRGYSAENPIHDSYKFDFSTDHYFQILVYVESDVYTIEMTHAQVSYTAYPFVVILTGLITILGSSGGGVMFYYKKRRT
ncbi:MAG: hypothetical protein ACTSRW_11465 [Candidatus Helarchaeota archaeon]